MLPRMMLTAERLAHIWLHDGHFVFIISWTNTLYSCTHSTHNLMYLQYSKKTVLELRDFTRAARKLVSEVSV